jgi:hypothetical protein
MTDLSPDEAAAVAQRQFDRAHSPAYETTAPMAVPQNGNIPAGWVSPEVAGAAERELHRQAILAEQAQAANADLEAEITNRINQSHGVFKAAGVHPLTAGDEASPDRLSDGNAELSRQEDEVNNG